MWHAAPAALDDTIATREAVERLRAAIRALPAVWRRAVVLRDLKELSYEEVADRLGVPIGTAKSRINRGRARLAAALAGRARGGGGSARFLPC